MTKGISSTLEYNWDNKLRSGTYGSQSISLKYDPDGNRIYKQSSQYGTRKYIVDIVGDLPTILMELGHPGNWLSHKYYYADSEVLAQPGGNMVYYIHDRLGSVRLATMGFPGGESYNYTPFGEDMNSVEYIYSHNPFKFTGQWYD